MKGNLKLNTTYPVSAKKVRLSIVIGDGNLGTTVVMLEEDILGIGTITDLELGKGSTLKGKALRTKTVVTDFNDKTQDLSVTYNMEGGEHPFSFTLNATTESVGASENFYAEIQFV